jgi:hypothetical protein
MFSNFMFEGSFGSHDLDFGRGLRMGGGRCKIQKKNTTIWKFMVLDFGMAPNDEHASN